MQRRLRLRHKDDFSRLKQQGETCQHRLCVMSYLTNGLAHNRYGFIVVKRVGKAVHRNRIKRMMREAIRSLHPELVQSQAELGYDIVFIARKPILRASFQEVEAAFRQTLIEAHLLGSETTNQKTVESD